MSDLFLKPFWLYYGAKWRAAPTYPLPIYDTIIEPFAGAAGYSMRYYQRKIVLVELDEVVSEVWQYLIRASAAEIMAIPIVDAVDDLPTWVPLGGRWLVGFNLGFAAAVPLRTRTAGLRQNGGGWGESQRLRCARQVDHIRHWRVIEGSYHDAPDIRATWFVDPPYQMQGKFYRNGSSAIDFQALGEWCLWRKGQLIVCENVGADWLPFERHSTGRGQMNGRGFGPTDEAIYVREV